jgi:hypothetical protein
MSTEEIPPEWAEAARREYADWTRFADGYQACPACGALVHPTYAKIHAESCHEIRRILGEREPQGRLER